MPRPAHNPGPRPLRRRTRYALPVCAVLGIAAFGASTAGAVLGFGLLISLAVPWLLTALLLMKRRRAGVAALSGVLAASVFLLWRASLTPSNNRVWEEDVSVAPHIHVEGATLTVRGLRSFTWHPEGHPGGTHTPAWTDRSYDLAALRGVDLIVEPFSLSGLMAHTMLSFDFGDQGRLLLSIEARKEARERYGAIWGGLNSYELIYVFSTEEDALTLRARKGYELIAYPTRTDPLWLRAFLLGLCAEANILREQPRFYHITRDNCTSAWLRRVDALNPDPFGTQPDTVLTGRIDKLLHRRGVLDIDVPLERARGLYRIDPAVLDAAGETGFSEKIREGRP